MIKGQESVQRNSSIRVFFQVSKEIKQWLMRDVQFTSLQRNDSWMRQQMQYQGNQLYKPIEPYQSAFDTYKYHSNARVEIHPVLDDILLAEDFILQSTDTLFDIGSTT